MLEDEVADSRSRVRCLSLAVGTLLKIQHLHEENWSPLASQMILAASKMFKKVRFTIELEQNGFRRIKYDLSARVLICSGRVRRPKVELH